MNIKPNVNLNSFLKFYFFLDYENNNIQFDFSNINKTKYEKASLEELVDIGIEYWYKSIEKLFDSNKKNVIPLSGGLDSRAILAALLKFTDSSNIYTYSYGSPNTYDFKIGNYIADRIGTKHTEFSLDEHEYKLSDLINISNRTDHQTLVFFYPNIKKIDYLYRDQIIWSGFMGGELAGSHMVGNTCNIIEDAKKYFINRESKISSVELTNCKDENLLELIHLPFVNKNQLSYEEQLDFQIRQRNYIAPHLMISGFNYNLPFINNDYLTFMLSLPDKFRNKKLLYNKMLLKAFPELFKMPTKVKLGLGLDSNKISLLYRKLKGKIYPNNFNVNYIDFDCAIREREDLKKNVYDNIMDLKKRKIVEWINISQIWKEHINKNANHSKALLTLASLEIHLKAGKII